MTEGQVFWYLGEWSRIATPIIIGLFAGWIAWRQWKTNHQKLRLDLFDRRYKVYRQTVIMLENLGVEAKRDQLRRFRRLTHQAAFLFDPSIKDFLKELDRTAQEMMHNQRQYDRAIQRQDHSAILTESERELKLNQWVDQQSKLVFEKFLPYLDFKNVAVEKKKE